MSKKDLSLSSAFSPSMKSVLVRSGYETLDDISSATPDVLSKDLKISVPYASQLIMSATQTQRQPPLTQSAASMVSGFKKKFSTLCNSADKLLDGGLKRGCVLEISGPPGCAKEALAINITQSFVASGQEVLFVDMQNMTNPAQVNQALNRSPTLPPHYEQLVKYLNLHNLPDLMMFFHHLPKYLEDNPKTALLVLNSFWFPFQSLSGLPHLTRNVILDRVKQVLTKVCASANLSVVITTQLATKLLSADGSPANFDTGSRAVLVPQPGNTYLPNGRTYRIIFVPQTRTSGVLRLLSSPVHVQGQDRQSFPEEPYETIAGMIQ